MDNYLDTLVKKTDQPSEEVSENKEEPVVLVAEVPAEEVKQEVPAEEVKEEAPKAEEPVKEEPKAEEKKAEEPKVEEPKVEETAESEIKKAEEKDTVEEEYTFMTDIRVYNIPDIKSPSKVISANIKKIKEVAGMIQVEYLKQGFGLVKGYIRK